MKKLISVGILIFMGYVAVSLMRLVFNLATGPMKYVHFFPFGFNIIEIGIVIFIVIAILNTLLKED